MVNLRRFDPQPITLQGEYVRLEPLRPDHVAPLFAVAGHPRIWQFMPSPPVESLGDMENATAEALRLAEDGTQIPFVIVCRSDNRVAGSTRFLNIRRQDRVLEIGWTWLGAEFWRTPLNTECKFLLMRHAFEDLGAVRVELKTDLRNIRSQQAMERIGCVREGVLRKHMRLHKGAWRDTVYYSVVDDEWPAIKERLLLLLEPR